MKIICPNLKNEEVAREFEELKNATSEAAAYHIWSQNNGNGIDKAPNGEPSKLFSDLLEHYKGDRVAAIQAKARTYSKSFKEWFGDWQFENKNNVSKVVDENGEPLIVYSGRPTKGATTFNLESKRSRTHLTGLIKKGVYFTKDKQIAEMYSGSRDYASQLDRDMAKYRFGEDGGALSMTKEEFLEIFPDVTSQYYDEMMEKYNRVVNDPDNFTGEFFASKIDIEGEVIPAFLNLRNTTTVDMQGSTIAHLSKEQKESINNSEGAIIENVDENASGIALTSGITTTYVAFNPNQIKSIDNQGTFSTQDNNIYNQKIVNRETRLENFYNSYVKLRTKTVEKAENETELRKRRSKLSSNSKLRETNLDAIMQEILGIYIYDADYSTTDSTLRELNNLSESRYLTLLNEEIDKLDRLLIPVDSLIAAVNNINKGYNKLSDYSKEVQDRLFNMPVYREATELPVITRAKSLKQYNAYQKIKYNKELNTFISNLKLTQLKLAARKYHLDTIKMFVEEYDRGFEDMKLKVLDEYLYRTSLLSKKAPKLQGTYNLLEDLAKGQSELDTRNANEQMQKISNVTNIKQALELLSKELPEYAPFIRHLQEIPYYEDILIEIDYNSEDSFALTKAVGNTSFKIDPETNEYTAKITINKESFGYRTLLHEIVHAFSSIALAGRDEYGNNEFVSDIIAIIDHCNKYFEIPKVFGILMQDSLNYGFTNPQEFIAEFFSNPAFQMLLKEIPAIGETEIKEKNIFKSVVEAITKFFASFFNKEKNLYNQIEPLMYKIIDFQSDLHKNNTIKYNPNREYNSDNYTNNQVITKVISNSKDLLDNSRSKMATVLRDVANKTNMQPVSIEYTDRPLNEIYPEATYWTPAIYDRNTNKIVVNRNGDFSRYGSLENVLLHEITHAITLDSLAANTEAANELRAIQKEYAAKYSDHASENVYEFAAELFSNPDVIFNMQDFSASTGEKTLLQKLIDWFKRLFNKNTTHQDLINKIVDNVIEFNAYKTLEKREDTHDYIPDVLPAASKREEISAMRLRTVFNDLVKTAENRVASLKYNTIEDKFDRNETIRNDKLLSSLNMLKNSLKDAEDIENITNYLNGMLDYVDNVIYSLNEAESVIDRIDEQLMLAQQSNNVDQMNKLRTALDNFGAEYIYPHESNLRRIHDELNIEFNNNVFSSILGENEFNNIVTTINGLIAELSSSKMPNRKNIGYKFKNAVIRTVEKFLRDEMESAHDPSVDNSLMNWLTFDGDLKWYNRWLATPVSSPQFVYRLIRKTIGDVNNKTHKQVYNKYAELKIAASATSDHSKLFEKDINGKKTGYFIRDRRYGVYQNNKYEWRKKWLKDHKLASVDELKLNPDLWVQYQIDYNEWKSENAERRYTPEFYRIFANLSMEANMALSEVNLDIENLLKPFIDETTKKPRFEKMALDEYEQYLSLLEKKRNLANPYDPITGEIKPEGSSEYNIAMELTEAYEQLSKGLKSKVNMEAFLDEMEKMKKLQGYTPDGKYTLYEAWLERNTRWEFTEEFQNLISKQNKADYGEVYDKLYQARANLLKLYRTDRYEPDYTRMPQLVKDKIKELDIAMYKVRSKAHKKGGNQRLFKSELSQIAKDNGGKNAVLPEDIWVDDNGVKHYHSYMTTVKPVLDKYMHRVPNSNWAETSEEAAYYNHNYDRNIPEAEQPKLSKKEYDNRREFDAVMRDPALKHLYDVLINTMDESNDKISHAKYKNNYKLPQVTGSIFNYAASKGLITGTRDFMSDAFAINPDDELHGVRVETRPNGTEINIMPTMYTSMLTDPSVGTNDLIGAVIKYYRMACNYQNKKEVAPQLNLLDSIISKEGYINNGKTTVQAENSALSQEVHKYLGFHLYGRTANFKDVSVNGRKISLEKIYRYFADWGRDLGLAWNPRSAISGGVSAWSFYAADSFISKFINTRDFLIANRELAKELVTLKFLGQFGKNISNSKLMGVLELNGLSFNQEEEFSNTNRWRLGRMAKRLTEPYAVFKMASILPNSVFAIGTYLNYRLLELEDGKLHFISENDFLNHHFPDKSLKEKKALYNNTKENLWGAYEMTKNGLKVKPKYAKYVNQDLENEVSSRLGAIASHAEGMVEEADKSGVYLSTALSSILMFRAFLPKNIENTLAPMYWNYQTKELAMGTLTAYWYAFNLQNLIGFNKNNYEKAVKLYGENTVKNQVKSYMKRANAQILTYIFWLTLFNIFSLGGDDRDDYYWSSYLRLELKKISLESGSRYNPMDVLNILNSLTPLINTAEDLTRVFNPIAYTQERKWKKIEKGSYKGLYGWQRDLLKVNKYTNAYYNMKNPAEKLRNLSNTLN